jgi:CheY-like chemotaxis protein
MPVLNGYQDTSRIREEQASKPHMPIVALTAMRRIVSNALTPAWIITLPSP